MKKKITLKELKVSSFATSLTPEEIKKTKGGIYHIPGNAIGVRGGKSDWTEITTRMGHNKEGEVI